MNAKILREFEVIVTNAPVTNYDTDCCAESAVLAIGSDVLFNLPGLDAGAGLRRASGAMGFYCKLLNQFLQSQRTVSSDIYFALAASDFQLAARLAHTLKGVAGNIGAMPLAQAAAEVDDAIREKKGGAIVKSRLTHLNYVLNEFCAALAAALDSLEIPDHEREMQYSTEQIIKTLAETLRRCDGEVSDYFDVHANSLRKIFRKPDFDALAKAVRCYEFDAALTLLEVLHKKVKKAQTNSKHCVLGTTSMNAGFRDL